MAHLDERVIIIEDTRELQCAAPDVVGLRTRTIGTAGAGGVTMADLVRSTLRLRPDRIVVGEVRGRDAIVGLWTQAMAGFPFVAFFAQIGQLAITGNYAHRISTRIPLPGAAWRDMFLGLSGGC